MYLLVRLTQFIIWWPSQIKYQKVSRKNMFSYCSWTDIIILIKYYQINIYYKSAICNKYKCSVIWGLHEELKICLCLFIDWLIFQCSVSFNNPHLPEGMVQASRWWQETFLEDVSLIQGFTYLLEGPLPEKVLANQHLGLLAARVQFLPCVWPEVHLPLSAQWEGNFLALEEPDSRNEAAIAGSKEDDIGQGILSQLPSPWNIASMKLLFMKVWVSSLGKRYSKYHREQSSYQSALRNTAAPQRVSSLEYLLLNSSNKKVHSDRWAKVSLAFSSAVKVVFILKINQFYSSSKQNQKRLYIAT